MSGPRDHQLANIPTLEEREAIKAQIQSEWDADTEFRRIADPEKRPNPIVLRPVKFHYRWID